MCREVPAVEWCWKVKFKKLVRSGGHLGPHLKSMDFMLSAVVPSEVLKRWGRLVRSAFKKGSAGCDGEKGLEQDQDCGQWCSEEASPL